MGKLSDKVCIVTGGGSGIGHAICEALAASGARAVYVVDINSDAAAQVAATLVTFATHPNFRYGFGAADVGKEEDIQRVIHLAWSTFGSVDAYFSNAGILAIGGVDEIEFSNEKWEQIWNINVMSHIFAARHLFPLWKEKRKLGIFVITASAAGLLAQIGSLPYHVTKHAAVSIADWLAISHHEDGVSVHCLCPQAVRTNMLTSISSPTECGPAGVDGIAEPKDVALDTMRALEEGNFLILPHSEVQKYFVRKATDYDRWIKGMRRVNKHFQILADKATPKSKL